MKHRRLAGFSFALVLVLTAVTIFANPNPSPAPARSTSSSSRTLTVAFWNIEWFPGGRPDPSAAEETRQIKAVQADMRQLNADVIGMEEVRGFAEAGVAVQPLREFKVDVCANFPAREGQNQAQEVAIASRLPALSAWAEEWKPNGAIIPPRGFAFAAYEIGPRQLLLVYCVHLKSNRGEIKENVSIRQESMRQLYSHMTSMQEAYGKLGTIAWIVGGDFNTSLDDKRFSAETTLRDLMKNGFSWAWQNTPVASRATLPPGRDFPAASFDHIFYRGATLRRAWVANTSATSSDHRAVAATFEIP